MDNNDIVVKSILFVTKNRKARKITSQLLLPFQCTCGSNENKEAEGGSNDNTAAVDDAIKEKNEDPDGNENENENGNNSDSDVLLEGLTCCSCDVELSYATP